MYWFWWTLKKIWYVPQLDSCNKFFTLTVWFYHCDISTQKKEFTKSELFFVVNVFGEIQCSVIVEVKDVNDGKFQFGWKSFKKLAINRFQWQSDLVLKNMNQCEFNTKIFNSLDEKDTRTFGWTGKWFIGLIWDFIVIWMFSFLCGVHKINSIFTVTSKLFEFSMLTIVCKLWRVRHIHVLLATYIFVRFNNFPRTVTFNDNFVNFLFHFTKYFLKIWINEKIIVRSCLITDRTFKCGITLVDLQIGTQIETLQSQNVKYHNKHHIP